MIRANTPNAFKTCYIAEVKEDLGLLTRQNRKGNYRKIKAPKEHKQIISEAINELRENGEKMTYKNIQQKAFEIYKRKNNNNIINKYVSIIKPSKNLSNNEIKSIVEDDDLIYED